MAVDMDVLHTQSTALTKRCKNAEPHITKLEQADVSLAKENMHLKQTGFFVMPQQ